MIAIDGVALSHQPFRRSVPPAALQDLLSDTEVETICHRLGHTWRRRIFGPAVTVRSMVYRSLHPDKSIRAVLADLAAADDRLEGPPADASWCQARSRLPAPLWPALIRRSVRRLARLAGHRGGYHGRPVYLVDGSTVSMPDTPQLVEAFGYANTKHGPSRFPVARITFLVRAGAEAVCDYRLDPYRTGEDAQFHALWHGVPSGCILLFDRRFCSFYNLAKLRGRRIDVVSRLHQCRRAERLILHGRRLGKDEWLVHLDLDRKLRKRYADPSLPKRLRVRLIRVRFTHGTKRRRLWVVTTLLNPIRYPRRDLVALYRRRWGIETRIGSLKTTLGARVLRSKTPAGVRSELAATVLAHNLVWTLIHQAANQTGTPADRISFVGAIQTVLAFRPVLRAAPPIQRRQRYRLMLQHIAHHTHPHRPGRTEPRLVKRGLRRYGFLKIPRDQARQECLS